MRDRAGLVGGSVEVVSSGGHGTVIRLRVPAGLLASLLRGEPADPLGEARAIAEVLLP